MQIFQERQFDEQFETQLNSLEFYNNYLFTGDNQGSIHKYELDMNQYQISIKSNGDKCDCFIANGKIEMIKVLPEFGNLLVLVKEALYYIDGKTLTMLSQVQQKDVTMVEINQNPSNQAFYFDRKQKKVIVVQFSRNDAQKVFETTKLDKQPSSGQFIGDKIFLGSANSKEYKYMMLSSKEFQSTALGVYANKHVHLQVINDETILCQSIQGQGIFIKSDDGQMQTLSPIQILDEKQIMFTKVIYPYLIIVYEKCMKVYNLTNSKELQTIDYKGSMQIKIMSTSGNKLLFGTPKELRYLTQTPYETLVLKYLHAGQIKEANQVLQSNVDKSDPDREKKYQKFYLDAMWAAIQKLDWSEVFNLISTNKLNLDVRELLSLYPELCPHTKIPQTRQSQTMTMIIAQNMSHSSGNSKDIQNVRNESEKQLAKILELLKYHYTKDSHTSYKEMMTFQHSQESLNGPVEGKISLEELLEIMDFVLINIFIKQQNVKQLKDFFKKGKIMCKQHYRDLLEHLNQVFKVDDNHQILAIFHDNFDKPEESLKIWQSVGTNPAIVDKKKIAEACESTVKILIEGKDKTQIQKYLKWVLNKDIEIGSKLFSELPDGIIRPDQMLDFFTNQVFQENDQGEQRKIVKEKYLEAIVLDRKIEEERFHTQLAKCYIEDQLYQIYPKNIDLNNLKDQKHPVVDKYRKKLQDFVLSPNAKYNTQIIFDLVDRGWLFTETIHLLSKLKEHGKALQYLIFHNEFLWAEKYCEEKNEKLFTLLFEKYIYFYNKSKDSNTRNIFKEKMFQLMKKYATHSQLDQAKVLELIPDDQILSDSPTDEGLYSFISSTISHTLHEKRSYKSAKNLAYMDQINVECNLIQAKQAFVKIFSDRKCDVCGKNIVDKAFVVYPNGVTVHFPCISKNNVCPTTGQDFQKTFKGI